MVKKGVDGFYVGIDVGGSRIKAVIGSRKKGVLFSKSILTKSDFSGEKIVGRVVSLVYSLLDSVGAKNSQLSGVGIGVPGIFEKSGKIINLPNLSNLNGVNFKEVLSSEFGCSKGSVKIVNDAQLIYFFHKEFLVEKNVAYLTMGTSLGCCLVLNGKHYIGSGLASQFAGSYFISSKKSMRVGDVLAIKYLLDSAGRKGLNVSGFKDLVDLLKSGDSIAVKVFEEYGKNLGIAVRNIFQILHLDKIYLCGGISHYSKYFLPTALKTFESNGGSLGVCDVEVLEASKKLKIGAIGAFKMLL